MNRKIRVYLDFIPLLILFISAAFLVRAAATSEILLQKRHYVGLIFLVLTTTLFFVRRLFGVLFLGLTLLLGLIGVLSYSPGIITTSFGFGDGENGVTLVRFQPIFLLWIVVYFTVSWRHIVGIGTRKYWNEVKNKER